LVDTDTSYKVIIGQRTQNQLGVVVSTPHMDMKFLGEQDEIIIVKAKPKVAREYYIQSLKIAPYSVKKPTKSGTTQGLTYLEEARKPGYQDNKKTPSKSQRICNVEIPNNPKIPTGSISSY